ncbi:MAG: class IV adenylate cyclase [Ignavibacteria bacterium]|nr:class IV adenylate cyclase [Ignavibacteria bacterium]MBT8381502.1 class IV adenylate cyclase [Ignavibacteria bacterium]MBT8391564.1 class IV adenylate cyclase [Ignavibacteria bacterium]NNJ52256.1 class IV adenylate cyclase [Ignavibacteriaceae bacterium]NNL22733.1 class IV adenylate cyclase [Ignavibacteriaceae bacterium]
MSHINIEIKAISNNQEKIRAFLKSKHADFKGVDHQIDTYYNVAFGRLKLREGKIEHHLIHYNRENVRGPKQSNVILYKPNLESNLKAVLTKALGILTIVDKKREIYFINNVKFHLDNVNGLGTFVEIEAIDSDGSIGKEKLNEQCNYYLGLFEIKKEDLIAESYSDLLLAKS